MNGPDLYPELDNQLSALTDEADDLAADLQAVAESTGMFRIDTLDKANWAIRTIGQHEARIAEREAFAQRERDRIDLWLDGERKRAGHSIEFLTGLLRSFWGARIAEDPTVARTLKLPAGVLAVRKSPDRVEVDAPRFVSSQPDDSTFVRVKREPNRAALLMHIKATGEKFDGVVLVEGEDRFTVKPHAEVDR